MLVEIWTDIICPWCGIGEHRLQTALARFDHGKDVKVVHRSFQLDESAPAGETQTARDMLKKKRGMSDRELDKIAGHLEDLAEGEGLQPYVVLENQVGNTSLAHELAAWATEQGHPEIWGVLFKVYFGDARSIFDVESLVAIATEHGLDGAAAREALTSRRYADKVRADGLEARELGAGGVPFVVIDRKYGVGGAQPVETFLKALDAAWATSHPET